TPHLPQPHLKKTLETLWEKEYATMNHSCKQPFRIYDTVNQYVLRYWNLAANNFYPSAKKGRFFRLDNQEILRKATRFIVRQKEPCVCLNDSDCIDDESFKLMKTELKTAFRKILPQKSSFEK